MHPASSGAAGTTSTAVYGGGDNNGHSHMPNHHQQQHHHYQQQQFQLHYQQQHQHHHHIAVAGEPGNNGPFEDLSGAGSYVGVVTGDEATEATGGSAASSAVAALGRLFASSSSQPSHIWPLNGKRGLESGADVSEECCLVLASLVFRWGSGCFGSFLFFYFFIFIMQCLLIFGRKTLLTMNRCTFSSIFSTPPPIFTPR